jgi:hypothetical protein
MNDLILIVWSLIGVIGLVGSLMGTLNWMERQRNNRASGRNGPRAFLVKGRVLLWRMHAAAFALWFGVGLVAAARTALSLDAAIIGWLSLGMLFLGFAIFAATVLVGNWYDRRLESML